MGTSAKIAKKCFASMLYSVGRCGVRLTTFYLASGRYLFLLDEFLEELSPQGIEATTLPTLDGLRSALSEQGLQRVQQARAGTQRARAGAPGRYHQSGSMTVYSRLNSFDILNIP